MPQRLQGKVAVVTGAASGIGLACARRFAEEGARVVGLDLRGEEAFHEAVGSGHVFHAVDVTDSAAQQAAVAATLASHGRIDVLLTAAGVGGGGPVHALDEAEWHRVIGINLTGTFLSCRAVLPAMMAQRGGAIITIASVEGLSGGEGGSAYNASKGGVVLLTKNMAIDYGRLGIRCNALCPGFIDTPLLSAVMDNEAMAAVREDTIARSQLGRLGQPGEMAAVAAFLASDDASFVTGQAIVADGGYLAGHRHGIAELMGLG